MYIDGLHALYKIQFIYFLLSYSILDYPRAMSTEDIHMEIHRAFMVWSEVVPLQFEELDHGDADITFQFERHYHEDTRPFDGTGTL